MGVRMDDAEIGGKMADNMRVRKPMLVAARLVDYLKSRCVALRGIWRTSSFIRSLTVLSSCILVPSGRNEAQGVVFFRPGKQRDTDRRTWVQSLARR